MGRLKVVFLDNVDSFTYNLVDEFARRGTAVVVFRNDAAADRVLAEIGAEGLDPAGRPDSGRRASLLVVSPGPGAPREAGNCLEVVRRALGTVPIFGVCLGHQALVEVTGGVVARTPTPLHGKATAVTHDGAGLFSGLPSPMPVGRYHSLAAAAVPDDLRITATAGDVVMGVEHRRMRAAGIQFHPESVLTPFGGALIANVVKWATNADR